MKLFAFLLILTLSLSAGITHAFELSLPLDCQLGKSCFIQKYVDTDEKENEWRDYQCNHMSDDGHKGTDFRLRNYMEMRKGYAVLAVAPGEVTATRDGMDDISAKKLPPGAIRDKECGNGVVIDHGKGWKTQYCHMKKGSILVEKGSHVERGQPLGMVGLSGQTEFPHVHMSVFLNNRIIDPFTGIQRYTGCGLSNINPLWQMQLLPTIMQLTPEAILNVGFATRIPPVEEVREGKHQDIKTTPDASAIILWADMMGIRTGDSIIFEIMAPNGEILHSQNKQIMKDYAQFYLYAGRDNSRIGRWPEGTYTGKVFIERENKTLVEAETTLTVAAE
ncbi:MAG: M23 family metallopeptidase [Hyphomicrobiales bacterium]|nr:M23 family metallopeptidase [Rickettsiales bacterium]MCP5362245.1 M23 family metallopeptidase [Hyphomicrobiales bacterium]